MYSSIKNVLGILAVYDLDVRMSYCVYMILCEDGSYYTGHSKNVKRRFRQHKKGLGARYTRMHKPKMLVYSEKFSTRGEAIRRERTIKMMTHKKKHKLADLST